LEIKLIFSTPNESKEEAKKEEKSLCVYISKKEETFDIPIDEREQLGEILWISIDPEFKVLKEIKSIKAPEEMFINQLKNGKTIIERIQAARGLRDKYSDEVIAALKDSVLTDEFYGVSVEASNTLGTYNDKNDHIKTNKAYEALRDFSPFQEKIKSPYIRRAVVRNIGGFERQESLDLLKPLLNDDSYFVEQTAATAIGKSSKNAPSEIKKNIIFILKEKAKTTNTFQNVLARGAIDGLKEFWNDIDEEIVAEIADFLIEMSKSYHTLVRNTAASSLGKFLRIKNKEKSQKVFEQLIQHLFKDKMKMVKISACQAFYDPAAFNTLSKPDYRMLMTIEELTYVAEHDLDGWVRRAAEISINKIREWIKEWSEKPPELASKLREERKNVEEKALEAMQRRILNAE
jgi:aminopeptidase N